MPARSTGEFIDCDVAVIGAGTAGIAAYHAAVSEGARAVLIEQGPGGTTCARVGCMPSKLLITAANAAHEAREADRFGIRVADVHVDGPAVMRRVRDERDRFVEGVFDRLRNIPEAVRIHGRAVFEGAGALRVDDGLRVEFRAAVIATGSSPAILEPLRDLGSRVLTTDSLFEIEDLPRSIAVLGGGPVGLEMAQALSRLGVETTLVDPGERLGGLTDPALAARAQEIFGRAMTLHLGAKVLEARVEGGSVCLTFVHEDGRQETARFACVLSAAGRPPNVRDLGLAHTGIPLDDDGLPDPDPNSLACAGAPLFVAGDANGLRPVLHEASRQGRIAGRNAARLATSNGAPSEAPEPWTRLAMVFTDPQIAFVGEKADADTISGSADFGDQGRARIMGRNTGLLRVHARPDGRLTGAEMIGPGAEHLAQVLAFAIEAGDTARSLGGRPYYHPTLEEGLASALAEIVARSNAKT